MSTFDGRYRGHILLRTRHLFFLTGEGAGLFISPPFDHRCSSPTRANSWFAMLSSSHLWLSVSGCSINSLTGGERVEEADSCGFVSARKFMAQAYFGFCFPDKAASPDPQTHPLTQAIADQVATVIVETSNFGVLSLECKANVEVRSNVERTPISCHSNRIEKQPCVKFTE